MGTSTRVSIDVLAETVMEGIESYANLTTEDVKKAVKKASKTVRNKIEEYAPSGKTGEYAKSWRVTTTDESSYAIVQTVHSPKLYMLAHLLEKGHAKRGGGRVQGIPHIKPAEQEGIQMYEAMIQNALRGKG